MHSVFLVEDEIVVREGIRNGLPWEESGFSLVGEAGDGEMALALIKDLKPDILVTDIRMPFMDGLALARTVKKIQPWIKIVILSGHDEFSYAQKAISIGVDEYLLKPVSAQDMMRCLEKLSARIEEERLARRDAENLKQRVMSGEDALKERWLRDLVSGVVPSDDYAERAREFGVDILARSYAVAIAEFRSEGADMGELNRAKNAIERIVGAFGDVISYSDAVDAMTFVIKGQASDACEETAYALAQGVKYDVERGSRMLVSVGIGGCVSRVRELPQSWAEARNALRYLATTGRFMIIGASDVRPPGFAGYPEPGSDPIVLRLRNACEGDVDRIVEEFSGLFGDGDAKAGSVGYYILYDIVVAARKLIDELGGSANQVFPHGIRQESIAEACASLESFRAEVRRIVEAVLSLRDSRSLSYRDTLVQRAKRFIKDHYADPDISLNTVASEVNVSPNHFSTVFSQESGETFIEYLTWTRIARAKELLLATGMKSSDIAYEVGYNDPHYFSFIFKKHTGKSPREFRSEKNIPES